MSSPEQHLAVAVIAQAIMDATGGNMSDLNAQGVHQAWLFLTSEKPEWAASRAFWAEAAGTTSEYIQRKALEMQDKHDLIMHRCNEISERAEEARAERRQRNGRLGKGRRNTQAEFLAEYTALLVAELDRRYEQNEPGMTKPEVAVLWRMHVGSTTYWLRMIKKRGGPFFTGRKSVIWQMSDGRKLHASQPKQRAPRCS